MALQHEVGHQAVVAGEGAHLGVVEGVGQEAHVDHEVGLDGHAVLEAEREDAHLHELLVGELGEGAGEAAPERARAQAARVDDEVRRLADAAELGALAGDGARDRLPGRGERVAPAVLVVAADEDVVGGVEEHHLGRDLVLAQLAHGVGELVEEPLGAEVAGDGEVTPHARVDPHELGELKQQPRGQVVDREVAHVLEDVQGLGAARPAHPRDDHDVGHARRALRRTHLLVGVCHGSPFRDWSSV